MIRILKMLESWIKFLKVTHLVSGWAGFELQALEP